MPRAIADIGSTGIASLGAGDPFRFRRVGAAAVHALVLGAAAGVIAIAVGVAGRRRTTLEAQGGEQGAEGTAEQNAQHPPPRGADRPVFRHPIELRTVHVASNIQEFKSHTKP